MNTHRRTKSGQRQGERISERWENEICGRRPPHGKNYRPKAGETWWRERTAEDHVRRKVSAFAASGYIHLRLDMNSGIKTSKIFLLRGHWKKKHTNRKYTCKTQPPLRGWRLYSLKDRCEFRYKNRKNFSPAGPLKKKNTHKQKIYLQDATTASRLKAIFT